MVIPSEESRLDNDASRLRIYADAYEMDDGNVVVTASLPSVARGTVRLFCRAGVLEIEARPTAEDGVDTDEGRARSVIRRTVDLPARIDPRAVKAAMVRGVLKIRAPKVSASDVEIA